MPTCQDIHFFNRLIVTPLLPPRRYSSLAVAVAYCGGLGGRAGLHAAAGQQRPMHDCTPALPDGGGQEKTLRIHFLDVGLLAIEAATEVVEAAA